MIITLATHVRLNESDQGVNISRLSLNFLQNALDPTVNLSFNNLFKVRTAPRGPGVSFSNNFYLCFFPFWFGFPNKK